MRENGHDAGTLIRARREARGDCDLWNVIAVQIEGGDVDEAREAARDHVARPRGVLVPYELGKIARQRDEIGLAVAVDVGRDHLVPAAKAGRSRARRNAAAARSPASRDRVLQRGATWRGSFVA